ncbi:MAG TPA: CPBP family intramembrane metalloprotease [Chitinophagaceae bacterium]|nr:CPBP family intramembrane metalloprotease [Chitinophagaceae bacterium]HNU15624.1 CPBP family intramembrane metalloprotease [Chitinophagaceae bacterium]
MIFLCFPFLITTDAWAKSQRSRSLADILAGRGKISALNSKYLTCSIAFMCGCLFYTLMPGNDTLIFEPVWNNPYSYLSIAFTVAALVVGYTAAVNIAKKQVFFLSGYVVRVLPVFIYLLLRIVFLFLYECFFRGILLFTFVDTLGVSFTISLNIALYTLAHAYSSKEEFFGAIPFGLLLCAITLLHHSVWPAIIIHLALAMSYEIKLVVISNSTIKSKRL